jgi:hypothetical protein
MKRSIDKRESPVKEKFTVQGNKYVIVLLCVAYIEIPHKGDSYLVSLTDVCFTM